MADRALLKRRLFVPEVIQTSMMDCGPAALKALCGGWGAYLSYGRLREACQTDVDGTSIDTLEEIAAQLGMQATQSLLPVDLLLLERSACLPAIAVVRLPDGAAHFVVLWRSHGSLVQIMDPAAGRLWMHRQRFLESLYVHQQPVARADWEEWSHSEVFSAGLASRMAALRLKPACWADRAHQDAALRLAGALCEAGKLRRGAEAQRFLALCADNIEQIPPEFWAVRPVPDNDEQVLIRGAVVLTVTGPMALASAALPDSLAAVRSEPPPRPWAPVLAAARESGGFLPGAIAVALVAAALGAVIEALLFRGLIDVGLHLELSAQRLAAVAALLVFLGALLMLEWPAVAGMYRLGRHLELRLRARFFLKIPRLSDRYFQSRLISDMAFRAHWLQLLRQLPELAGQLIRLSASLVITALAIAWLYPGAAVPALLAVALTCGIPLLFLPALIERDLRYRETSAALSRFYLDALLGSRAIQAHDAERALRAAHSQQLRYWAEAGLRQQALIVRAETTQSVATLALVIGIVYAQTALVTQPASLLLLIYWAISIALLGQQLATLVWSLPALRNTLLRFLEPLGSPEEEPGAAQPAAPGPIGAKVDMEDVSVMVGGHRVLEGISLHVKPGEHVGVVGLSGAGKSSLLGLLLGWYAPSQGEVCVDDLPLDAAGLARLRRDTAWIDPQVQLFRTTLFDNLCYGNGEEAAARVGAALKKARLENVLKRLPQGMQTPLGEGGTLVSGGEGQGVRIGRAMGKSGIRLALLDEPARGLDRDNRRSFLATARSHFAGATLFHVTHDIAATLDFDRVLVIENGAVLEQGAPLELCEQKSSRYRQLLDEETAVSRNLWSHSVWRRLRLRGGALAETQESRA